MSHEKDLKPPFLYASKTGKAQVAKLKCRLGTISCFCCLFVCFFVCFSWTIGQFRQRHQNQQTAKCKVLAVETYTSNYSVLSSRVVFWQSSDYSSFSCLVGYKYKLLFPFCTSTFVQQILGNAEGTMLCDIVRV